MPNRQAIIAEITAISPSCAQWPVEVPYRVPACYFETLSEFILEHLATGLPVKTNVYAVPENYFEQLPENLLRAIRHEAVSAELEEVAPFLKTIPKTVPYTLPAEPMLNLQAIMEEGKNAQKGKLVSMPAKKVSVWMRYAVAAVMAGILVTAVFVYTGGSKSATDNLANLAQMDISSEISKLSEDELTTYLSSAEKLVIATADREPLLMDELPDVNDHLEYMSDDELNEYLQESAEVASGETVGTNN